MMERVIWNVLQSWSHTLYPFPIYSVICRTTCALLAQVDGEFLVLIGVKSNLWISRHCLDAYLGEGNEDKGKRVERREISSLQILPMLEGF